MERSLACHLGSHQHHHNQPRHHHSRFLGQRTEERGLTQFYVLPLLGRSGAQPARTVTHVVSHPASILPCLLRGHDISWSTIFCSTPSLKPSFLWYPPTKTHAYVLVLRACSMPARQCDRSIWWRHHKDWIENEGGAVARSVPTTGKLESQNQHFMHTTEPRSRHP